MQVLHAHRFSKGLRAPLKVNIQFKVDKVKIQFPDVSTLVFCLSWLATTKRTIAATPKANWEKQRFSYQAIKEWNEIDIRIRNSDSLSIFKRKYT